MFSVCYTFMGILRISVLTSNCVHPNFFRMKPFLALLMLGVLVTLITVAESGTQPKRTFESELEIEEEVRQKCPFCPKKKQLEMQEELRQRCPRCKGDPTLEEETERVMMRHRVPYHLQNRYPPSKPRTFESELEIEEEVRQKCPFCPKKKQLEMEEELRQRCPRCKGDPTLEEERDRFWLSSVHDKEPPRRTFYRPRFWVRPRPKQPSSTNHKPRTFQSELDIEEEVRQKCPFCPKKKQLEMQEELRQRCPRCKGDPTLEDETERTYASEFEIEEEVRQKCPFCPKKKQLEMAEELRQRCPRCKGDPTKK